MRRDGVDVRGVGRERDVGAGASRRVDQLLEQVMRALRAFAVENRLERFDPFLGFERIGVIGGRRRGKVRQCGHGRVSSSVSARTSLAARTLVGPMMFRYRRDVNTGNGGFQIMCLASILRHATQSDPRAFTACITTPLRSIRSDGQRLSPTRSAGQRIRCAARAARALGRTLAALALRRHRLADRAGRLALRRLADRGVGTPGTKRWHATPTWPHNKCARV